MCVVKTNNIISLIPLDTKLNQGQLQLNMYICGPRWKSSLSFIISGLVQEVDPIILSSLSGN